MRQGVMKQNLMEVAVGAFMVAGLAALFVLAMQVSGLSMSPAQQTYKVYASFNDVGGLSVRGQVAMAGVTIGRVSAIRLDDKTYQAIVEMDLYESVRNIPADSTAVIRTSGLLGEKYIDVSVGGDEAFMAPGDYFYATQSSLNLEKLISTFAAGNK